MGKAYNLYAFSSVALTASTIYYAYISKFQFFPTLVYLYSSKISSIIIGNFFILCLLTVGNLVKFIFLGELRDAEKEVVQDNIKSSLMEFLLFMTIFRDELSASFVAYFSILIFFKIFHWMAEQRVNFMEQLAINDRVSYFKMLVLMILLLVIDMLFITFAIISVTKNGPSIKILFGFEYALLAISIITTSVKFSFNLISLSAERIWEQKGAYVLYLEFISSTFKILVYTAFFLLVYKYYGFPLHMMRSLYFAWGRFYNSYVKLIKYRKAVNEMNVRFLDATEQDLQNIERICIVCREEMHSAKKLPCGHILHKHCLTSWLESSQQCPLCRAPVLVEDIPVNGNQQIVQLLQQLAQQNQNGFQNFVLQNQNAGIQNNVQNVNHQNLGQNEQNLNLENVGIQQKLNINVDDPNTLYDAIEEIEKAQNQLNNCKIQMDQIQNQISFLQNFIMDQIENKTQVKTEIENEKEEKIVEIKQEPKKEVKKASIIKSELGDSNDNLDLEQIRQKRLLKFSSSSSQNLTINEEEDK